ncbi:hypothetical protein SVTN_01520 [Streptomyces vietnamensis]|uniref:DDE Tnp4 domain-containing protein n=1 Tax=Streptomyces vietnamensis TaxID=362257 RepID=A0A0B5HYI1_9ACTN|nr:hypothetical protein SVTN_01520 [Streptomyces vietnamensis]
MNVQVLTDPFGRLLGASPALPGSPHDLTAARAHGVVGALAEAGLKGWRLLRKLRCSTNRIADFVKAVLVLHHAPA